jgi:hypothetical protein
MIFAVVLLSCPWLNPATAAGILGGPVTQRGCDFGGLQIEVIKEFKPDCVPLRGIGTEAQTCSDGVVFRVREKVFIVRIEDREKARKVAEMVAGSMF